MPRVSEVMISDVVTIDSSASIIDAARQMISEEKGPLPVMEGDSLRAVITDRDIIAHVVAEGRDPNSMTVQDIATQALVTIGPDQDVQEARRLMDEHQLDRVLVLQEDRLVRMVSEADIRSEEGPLT
jgi:CBS domain-containing protein